jgi:NAD(P)-dependent dehydrogenase (short-subunit alcohol dehydrogenase family)
VDQGVTLADHVCVVTGASSGIGRAVVTALAADGAAVWALARDEIRLGEVARESTGNVTAVSVDLADEGELERVAGAILARDERVDVLVHSAGRVFRGPVEEATTDELDALYHVTLRGPFVLTRALLPGLKAAGGRVVWVNSLVPPGGATDAVLYASMKQAARTFADGLRQEVNAHGIRVTTLSPGRTDTPMQEWVHTYEQREYDPELLLSPGDVAGLLLSVLAVGSRGEVTDVNLRPVVKFGARRP